MDVTVFSRRISYGIGALFVAGMAYSAHAWTWARYVTVYNGAPGLCVQGDAGIDHFQPGVFSGNIAYSSAYARSLNCGTPAHGWWAATLVEVHRAAPGAPAGALCRRTNWDTRYTGADAFGSPTGPSIVFDYGGPASCGPGWYGTFGAAFVWDGSAWRGGWVWSGWEWVGGPGVASASAPPSTPAGIDVTGKVDADKVERQVLLAGSDGNLIKEAGGENKKVSTAIGSLPPTPLAIPSAPQ